MIYLLINYYIIRGRIARIQQSKLVADLMSDTFFLIVPVNKYKNRPSCIRKDSAGLPKQKVDVGWEEIKISFESIRGMEWGQ